MNGHLNYNTTIMIPNPRIFEEPKHTLFATGGIQPDDLSEIQIVRELATRLSAIPKSELSSVKIEPSLFSRTFSSVIAKTAVKIPRGTVLRKNLGKIVWSLPERLRNSIVTSLAGGFLNSKGSKVSYSEDLGFGLDTSKNPRASIIIPVHNQWFTTLKCLQALQRNCDRTPFEIILVDDGSSDSTFEAASQIRGIQIIRIHSNVGYLRATNLGATYANSEYLILLNNDTEPVSGWLDELVSFLDKNPEVAIGGSTLLYPDGSLQESGAQIFAGGNAWNLGRGGNPSDGQFRFPREVDYASAASIVVRKTFWDMTGGFDEQFAPAYCEDSDLCMTAWKLGFKVFLIPNSWVIHHEGVSHGTSTSSGLKKYQVKNTKKMQEKWVEELTHHWKDNGIPRIERQRASKGIVFLVDRQLPAFNRDSGSVRSIQIAKHIMALGYHVVMTALDSSTTEKNMDDLRKIGVEVHSSYEDALRVLAVRKSRISHVWLIRNEVYKFFAPLLADMNNQAIQIADLLDLDYKEEDKGIRISQSQIDSAMAADQVVLVSEFESRLLQTNLPGIKVKPLWYEFNPVALSQTWEESSGLVFVGGFRHQPNTEGILWFARDVLPLLREKGFESPIRVVGTGMSASVKAELQACGLDVMGRQDDLQEVYRKSRVAIVPLLSGRGKKGKLAEALSLGIPVVTTEVGAESFDFQSIDAVAVVNRAEDFASAIFDAHDHEDRWTEMHEFGLSYCDKYLSTASVQESVREILF